jgi:hypothetical protein
MRKLPVLLHRGFLTKPIETRDTCLNIHVTDAAYGKINDYSDSVKIQAALSGTAVFQNNKPYCQR